MAFHQRHARDAAVAIRDAAPELHRVAQQPVQAADVRPAARPRRMTNGERRELSGQALCRRAAAPRPWSTSANSPPRSSVLLLFSIAAFSRRYGPAQCQAPDGILLSTAGLRDDEVTRRMTIQSRARTRAADEPMGGVGRACARRCNGGRRRRAARTAHSAPSALTAAAARRLAHERRQPLQPALLAADAHRPQQRRRSSRAFGARI